jgi:hypothetical protein
MSQPDPRLDRRLRALSELPPPPPSPALLEMVHRGPGASTRAPARTLAFVVGVALAAALLHTLVAGVRKDLAELPPTWFYATAVAWLVAFFAPLAVGILPRRGSVLADSGRAAALAIAVPVVLTSMAIWLRVDAPPATLMPPAAAQLHYLGTCLSVGLGTAAVPFALAVYALRRAARPVATFWLGAAIGAANGALAAFVLHVHCPIGGALHVAVGHAGASVIGALVGALVVPAIVARRAD